jgi:hypothetical protein
MKRFRRRAEAMAGSANGVNACMTNCSSCQREARLKIAAQQNPKLPSQRPIHPVKRLWPNCAGTE